MILKLWGKCFFLGIICFMLLYTSSAASAKVNHNAAEMYEVYFPDQKPFIDENNRTLIPVRFISEQLGADVSWNDDNDQVTIAYKGDLIYLTAGCDQAIRITNGQPNEYPMGTKAVLIQGRIMVPLRFLSEAMGSKVIWNENANAVVINQRMVINLSDSPLNLAYLREIEGTEVKITDFCVLGDVYFSHDKITAHVDIQNNDCLEKILWLQLAFQDPMDQSYYTCAEKVSLKPGESLQIPLTWVVPSSIITGSYGVTLDVWDNFPGKVGSVLLANTKIKEGVRLYKTQEDFWELNSTKWRKTSHALEGTTLKPSNVCLSEGKLMIHLPEGVFEGGEIQSCRPMGFGSYEILMKLPDVPSSITGFFLYKSPAFHNEIDIEIYNQRNGEYFLTTYAEGEKKNLFIDKFPFDPTAEFHNYRIDYFPNQLRFYADNVLLKEWNEGLTNESMYIVVNTWYPDWLAKCPAKQENMYLEIEWIRY